MKYILMAGEQYYPSPRDLRGIFDSLEEAIEKKNKIEGIEYMYWVVIDSYGDYVEWGEHEPHGGW